MEIKKWTYEEYPDFTEEVAGAVRIATTGYQHLKQCKKEVYLYLLEGADHGGIEFWSEEIQEIVEKFIKEHI